MFPTQSFIDRLSTDLQRDLVAFVPELILCGAIVAMLLGKMVGALSRLHMGVIALVGGAIALACSISMWPVPWTASGSVPLTGQATAFSGLLVFDSFGLYLRVFLLAFLCLSLWLSMLTGIPDREDSADYSTLLVGGTLGMMLMVSANHLLMAFLAVEMASLPSYLLAGFLKGRRQGSEAALKYVVYGASASGVMLYGISLIAGTYGTGLLPEITQRIADPNGGMPIQVVIGVICVVIGLGFKLSAVPFHFWCPDVFEGAAAEVGAFLSVASKAAALALTARFLFSLTGSTADGQSGLAGNALAMLWALFAAITTTFGNLAALAQTNMKRLLAYSTIAHAGFMMMALIPIGPRAVGPLLYYISAYLLMNLGAFAVVALVRNQTGSEDVSAYRGLIRRSPFLAIAMAFFLLSLLGLPPLAGFAAKFQVFAVIYDMGRSFGATDAPFAWIYFGLLGVAGLNTAVSAGYYLKVLRAMMLDDPADDRVLRISIGGRLLVGLLVLLVIAGGILWDPLTRLADRGTRSFEKFTRLDPGEPFVNGCNMPLLDVYRRESLSFLQYVRQATPYAGANDKLLLERVREMAQSELAEIEKLADYLDRSRISLPHLGAFPSTFTNYNFVSIRKLLPLLVKDESRGLAALENDLSELTPGEGRDRIEKLVAAKQMHLGDLQKLAA